MLQNEIMGRNFAKDDSYIMCWWISSESGRDQFEIMGRNFAKDDSYIMCWWISSESGRDQFSVKLLNIIFLRKILI
ncbi:unnamed protein product [Rotaria magnacalcarata]|uniref:Uncharacterized protein n=1 Tax=Rotaria magnacalcarata TaxID=392030 RepID=A0A8S3HMV7_9BILA|nr:unnamed protein product [Rotaria magnacalcarata]